MAGARSILTAPPYQTPGQRKMAELRALKGSATTRKAQQKTLQLQTTANIVQSLVDRKKGLVTVKEVTALAQVTGTPKLDILRLIEEAKEKFSGAAVEYVDLHKQATQMALANGDAKSLEVATRAAQWAIEKIAHDGKRVIEKEQAAVGSSGTKILIGINLGGKNPTYTEADVVETPLP